MKKLLIIVLVVVFAQTYPCQVVLVPLGGGRFGNQTVALLGAMWLKYKYGLEIVLPSGVTGNISESYKNNVNYFPFKTSKITCKHRSGYYLEINHPQEWKSLKRRPLQKSDKLLPVFELNKLEQTSRISKNCSCKKKKKLVFRHATGSKLVMYQKNFDKAPLPNKGINWSDKKFRSYVRNTFASLKKSSSIKYPPKNKICIALHYREGGTIDKESRKPRYPTKFLPLSFYCMGVKEILKKIPENSPIYIGVFSDAVNSSFMNILKKEFKKYKSYDIQLEFLSKKSSYLDDFFTMAEYDFLVRGYSTFSVCAEKLGNFAGVYQMEKCFQRPEFYWYQNCRFKAVLNRIKRSK